MVEASAWEDPVFAEGDRWVPGKGTRQGAAGTAL